MSSNFKSVRSLIQGLCKALGGMTLLIALITACDNNETHAPEGKPTIKIGVSLPLTGNMAEMGEAARAAAIAAEKDINKNTQNKFNYELIIENDAMEPKQINAAAQKLVYLDKVDAIVAYFSVAGRIIAPIANKNKIINFNVALGDDVLTSEYNFQNFMTVDAMNKLAINFFNKNKITEIDLLYQNIGSAEENLESLIPMLDANNIKYNIHRFNKGEVHFDMLISKIKDSNSQAVFLYTFMPELDIIAKNIQRRKLNKIIAYNDEIPMSKNISLHEGSYNIGSPAITEELKSKWELAGKNSAYATYMYDIINQIAYGFENTSGVEGKKPIASDVSKTLHSKKEYKGIVTDYKLDERGQFHSSGKITQIKNGKAVLLEE